MYYLTLVLFWWVLFKDVCSLNFKDWYADALTSRFDLITKRYKVSKSVIDDVLLLYFLIRLYIVKYALP